MEVGILIASRRLIYLTR